MLENQGEIRKSSIFSWIFPGFPIFFGVLAVYVVFLSLMSGPASLTLATACHWDCGWFSSIARNGYVSPVPPLAQDVEHSNVAFFPLFPMLGRLLVQLFSIPASSALPLVALAFALPLCVLLPTLTNRKRLIFLLAYPATFYFFVAYTESLYCFSLFMGFWLLFRRSEYSAGMLYPAIFLAGLGLGATRLSGFVIPVAVFGIWFLAWIFGRAPTERRFPRLAGVWAAGAVAGIGGFFLYCHWKFGAWNLYLQTLDIGWNKEVSVSGFFRYFFRALLKNIFPYWFAKDPTRMSWIVTADTLVAYGYVIFLESRRIFSMGRKPIDSSTLLRFGILAGGLGHILMTTLGDSGEFHRWGNGMRYTMPALYLLVFVWDADWTPKWLVNRPVWRRNLFIATLVLWIPYQLYYLYLFTQNFWVS